ncbi:MAG: D-alanyl-D-alanine carboxypeptidase [Chlorobi bacterium]|nr:D-alanyl-D-alanine carboxypeptidase [Chlorobiota bacterium]
MRYFYTLILLLLFGVSLFAQSETEKVNETELVRTNKFSIKSKRLMHRQLDKLTLFNNSFSGLCVYDVKKGKYIAEYNADKYFTPASNTKIFTFYNGIINIGNNIPVLFYAENSDSLIFWGSGAPTLLYSKFNDTAVYNFLKNTNKKLVFSGSNFRQNHFGSGWAWDDYEEYYSKEISSLPVYGNAINLTVYPNGNWAISPKVFFDSVKVGTNPGKTRLHRELRKNLYTLELSDSLTDTLHFEVPFITSNQLAIKLLSDTLGKNISISDYNINDYEDVKTLYGIESDTVFKVMMQESDNYLAEHILLMCAEKLEEKDSITSSRIIKKFTENYLSTLTNQPRWVDGSGLSRYNLFTPKSMVETLNMIRIAAEDRNNDGLTKLFDIFPTGGKGTLKHRFNNQPPFIHAKTGTLSNNHNLSGYLTTKSGKLLIFSYMNNHYRHKTSTVQKQTDKILEEYYLRY